MGIGLVYSNEAHIFTEREENHVPYLEYPILSELGIVKHGFSTRLGGVSTDMWTSMNLSFSRGDDKEAVKENFKRMTGAIHTSPENLVFSAQTHTTNIRIVTEKDKGKGYVTPLDYQDVDGLITNEPGLCLATFFADCVPLYFVDPVKKAIGLSHAGWRGTVGKIGKLTIEKMGLEYGCQPKDIIATIGPSICQACYEVSEDVIQMVRENYKSDTWADLFYKKENEKYQLNLWKANEIVLKEAGILGEHMAVTNVCTCCNETLLYSHRASHGKRGNLGAFLELR